MLEERRHPVVAQTDGIVVSFSQPAVSSLLWNIFAMMEYIVWYRILHDKYATKGPRVETILSTNSILPMCGYTKTTPSNDKLNTRESKSHNQFARIIEMLSGDNLPYTPLFSAASTTHCSGGSSNTNGFVTK